MKFLLGLACVCLGAMAQLRPTIGIIDTYGNRDVSREKLAKTLSLRVGDPLPPSKQSLEEALVQLKGVTRAHVETVCCEAGKAIFYIGVEESGQAHLDLREYPTAEGLEVPPEVVETHGKLIGALADAVRAKETAEDWRLGYALIQYTPAQQIQLGLPELVERNQSILRRVLRESADPDDRTLAATMLGYGPKGQGLIDDLQYALRDPEQPVRGAALRSLAPLWQYANERPQTGLRVLSAWFVEMLNSVAWQDRMNAVSLLLELSVKRDEYVMRHIRERAIPALSEMALWQHLPHALPAYILLGRAGALTEEEIQRSWSANERAEVVKKIRKRLKG